MKYLIVGADDLGYCEPQNQAILELYRRHLITSTSLLAPADIQLSPPASEKLLQADLPCGVHLCISSDEEDQRWHSLSGGPSLSDAKGLYYDSRQLALHVTRRDVRRELMSQYRYLACRGITVDHADCHSGTLYGLNGRRYWLDVFEFCQRLHLPLRFPRRTDFLERQLGKALPPPLRLLFYRIRKEADKRQLLLPDDILSNPWNVEKIGTYERLQQYYLKELELCQDGVTELFLHPSLPADLGKQWQKRVWEYELLKSGCLLEKAEEEGFRLISYRDLALLRKEAPEERYSPSNR